MGIEYRKKNVIFGIEGMDEVYRMLGDLRDKAPSAAKNAINATARRTRRLMIDKAKARYTVNAAGTRHLRDLKQVKKARETSLDAILKIGKMRNDLGYFEHSPTRTFTGADVRHKAPEYVSARVLYSSSMTKLTGEGKLSKGFLVQFKSGHIGMVQRHTGSDSKTMTTEKSGKPRWKNKDGRVEKLVTMGSPSATAMHYTVFRQVQPEMEDYLQESLRAHTERVIERAREKK